MILPNPRDPRFTTIRRGGTLADHDHHRLALWAARCADHVLPLFEAAFPRDDRPRRAVELTHAWVAGAITMTAARVAAFHANTAARDAPPAAKYAAYAAGQAVAVAHVAAHYLGAASYAIRAVWASVPEEQRAEAGRAEALWQLEGVPEDLLDLVLDDQGRRNALCWNTFLPPPRSSHP